MDEAEGNAERNQLGVGDNKGETVTLELVPVPVELDEPVPVWLGDGVPVWLPVPVELDEPVPVWLPVPA